MKLLAAAAFLGLSLLDIVTTHVALTRGAVEGNPFAVMLAGLGGEPVVDAVKVAAVATIVIVCLYRRLTLLLWAGNVWMLVVIVNNSTHLGG